jgi:cytochrome c
MKKELPFLLIAVVAAPLAVASVLFASGIKGNAGRGQRVFGACAACHSLQPDKNMTGPSLANLWNRKAGSLQSFSRYSPALKSSDVVWNDQTLEEWIKDPQHVVPGNEMTFVGIKDAQPRADLLAFLKEAQKGSPQTAQQEGGPMGGMTGGMGGMMGGRQVPNLKKLYSAQRVQTITYCKDTRSR